MIAQHLINGMVRTDDEPTTRAKAKTLAKNYRKLNIHAIILPDDETKKYSIFVPVGVTLSLF